jgi:uncharacterized protein YcbX
MKTHATISALHVYPVKSCAGLDVPRVRLSQSGLSHDRHWLIVRPNGRFVTQREFPRLALIRARVVGGILELAAPGMPPIRVQAGGDRDARGVTIWRDNCSGIDQGDEGAAWLQKFLGIDLRLVEFDVIQERLTDPEWSQGLHAVTEFSDGYSLLVISEASLDDLNTRLAAPLPMNRFRPNIVIRGVDAYDEDHIHELSADGVKLRLVKPCVRCVVTTTDQQQGVVRGDEPLRTLKTYRWNAQLRGIAFGQNALLAQGAGVELAVGQQLAIAWKSRSG